MPLLGPLDALPTRPQRVLVAGPSGSGKTMLARRVAQVVQAPHTEIDGLFHGAGWTERESFAADVRRVTARPSWVTEWQYAQVRALLADRADLLVWLDLPRHVVMRQVVGRTLRRRLRNEELWNGNTEPPLWTFLTDREHIVRWAWSTHDLTAERVSELRQRRPDLPVVRMRSRTDTERWLAGPLAQAAQGADP